MNDKKDSIVLYTNKNGEVELRTDTEKDTLWATQAQISVLFEVDVRTINEHLKKIFISKELKETSVIRKSRITARDGKQYLTAFYNLDAIIAVGYRVNSKKATKFRIWATAILREYLVKGFNLNKSRLVTSEEKLENLHKAIDFIESKSDKPLKGKIRVSLVKDLI
jgi:hypothetical protein